MQTINYLIVDGDVSGRVKCSIDESTIIAYRISLKHLSKGVDDFDKDNWTKKSGIYLLIARNYTDKPPIYIGQADLRKNGEGFIARLSEHMKNPPIEWHEVILLTVKDNYDIPLDAVEHKFWEDAGKKARCALSQAETHDSKITDERRGFFNNFVKYGEFFVGILGHRIYEPVSKPTLVETNSYPETTVDNDEVFKYKSALAYGKRTDEGFVILKGAKIAKPRTNRGTALQDITRKQYNRIDASRAEREYAIDKSKWETTEDLLFGSPHEAGGFVSGTIAAHVNFWIDTKTNLSLKEIQKAESDALARN